MPLPKPVIVVPGITAVNLRDDYPVPPETVWSAVLEKEYERAALHPDQLKYEALEPARVMPDQVFEIAYKELIEEVRHNLTDKADTPVPVFPFSYDWRQPLDAVEPQLRGFIDEVIERTSLMRHYFMDGYRYQDPASGKVNLVGHSMGGLLIAGTLQRFGGNSRVEKVVTLASPFRGSLEAVLKITTGLANLGTGDSSSRERETARLTPALYELLPSFLGAVQTAPGMVGNLLDPGAWQPSVVQTLAQYLEIHGRQAMTSAQAQVAATALFEGLLNVARQHRQRLEGFSLAQAGLGADDWLCVAGVGSETRVNIRIELDGTGQPRLVIDNDTQMKNGWGAQDPNERVLTGDGTVPYLGARASFIPVEKVVCVSPDDFGYWEVQDKLVSRVAGFHGILPNMDMLHRLIVRFFKGEADPHGNTWGRRPPDLPAGVEWNPPLTLRERS
jgi:pimeloyl-ACP methyl ester carboxylesterase